METSAIGGCCDPEFQEWSNGLLEDFEAGRYGLLLSSLTDAEIEEAPEEVKDVYFRFRELAQEALGLTDEAIALADEYLRHGIVPESFVEDARRIAIATVAAADIPVSWNFKHIVRYEMIQKFNPVNLEMGYKPISIHSPREVATHIR